jgi:hypothetical protein
LLDLRLICTEAADYAPVSPIEPSSRGGQKIAAAIAALVCAHDTAAAHTIVYGAAPTLAVNA